MRDAGTWVDWIESYVDDLVARGHIRSERVERAFRRVPRHRCIPAYYARDGRWVEVPQDDGRAVPAEVVRYVYSDSVPLTKPERGAPVRSSLAPAVMAQMLEALDLHGGERVLEIGTGTGYGAALLAEITGTEVVTVDIAEDVAEAAQASLRRLGEARVTVVAADGYHSHVDGGPYDRVIVSVGAPGIAEPWLDQLELDAFLVAPVSLAGAHPVLRVERGRPWTASGSGVCWSDLIAGGGALAHRPLRMSGSPADGGPLVLEAPEVVRLFEPPLDEHAYEGLVAFVAISDRRGELLEIEGFDPELGRWAMRDRSGAVAMVDRGGVAVDGSASLTAEIRELIERWLSLGRPRFADWRFELFLQDLPAGRYWRPVRWTTTELAHQPSPADPARAPASRRQP